MMHSIYIHIIINNITQMIYQSLLLILKIRITLHLFIIHPTVNLQTNVNTVESNKMNEDNQTDYACFHQTGWGKKS